METPTSAPEPFLPPEVGAVLVAVGVGGSIFYFLKGVCIAPKGRRLAGGAQSVLAFAPRLGRWAAFVSVMTAIERGVEHVRGVQDPLNSAVGCAGAHALFSARHGPRAAANSALDSAAVSGAIILGVKGLQICLESRAARPS